MFDLEGRGPKPAYEGRNVIVIDRIQIRMIVGRRVKQIFRARAEVVAGQVQVNFGVVPGLVQERHAPAVIERLAVFLLAEGVVYVAIVVVIVEARPHRKLIVNQRARQDHLVVPGVVSTELGRRLVLHGRRRFFGDVLDGTADIGPAVQGTLRALQDFDPLDVARPDDLSFEQLYVVHIEADALHDTEGADSPQGDVRTIVVALDDMQVRHQRADVVDLRHMSLHDRRVADGYDRRGDIAQILTALAGGDENLRQFLAGLAWLALVRRGQACLSLVIRGRRRQTDPAEDSHHRSTKGECPNQARSPRRSR